MGSAWFERARPPVFPPVRMGRTAHEPLEMPSSIQICPWPQGMSRSEIINPGRQHKSDNPARVKTQGSLDLRLAPRGAPASRLASQVRIAGGVENPEAAASRRDRPEMRGWGGARMTKKRPG